MRILSFLTLFLFLAASAASQTFGGVGARAEGMGGAFVAVADDASAVYWNPAGIASVFTFDFQASGGPSRALTGSDSNGTNFFIGAALPVLGLSFYRTHTVHVDPDRENMGSGAAKVRLLTTSNVGVTFVQTIVTNVVIGTTARVVHGGVEGFDTRTMADFDVGAMVSVGNVRVGVTGRNLREPEYDVEGEGRTEMERQVRVGAALVPRSRPAGVHGPFSLAFDIDMTETASPIGPVKLAALGGEYWIAAGRVGLRAGLRWNTLDTSERFTSGGLTVRFPRSVHVDGQLTKPNGDGDSEWLVSARITF
jgi:F plasmid transfer operon, TraF, protein